MSRGIPNDGFQMEENPVAHYTSERMLPGQIDDRYYRDDSRVHSHRHSRGRERRVDDQWYRENENTRYRPRGYESDRQNSEHPETKYSSNYDQRNDWKHSGNGGAKWMDGADKKHPNSINNDRRREMDAVEERLKRFQSSADDRYLQDSQQRWVPEHSINPNNNGRDRWMGSKRRDFEESHVDNPYPEHSRAFQQPRNIPERRRTERERVPENRHGYDESYYQDHDSRYAHGFPEDRDGYRQSRFENGAREGGHDPYNSRHMNTPEDFVDMHDGNGLLSHNGYSPHFRVQENVDPTYEDPSQVQIRENRDRDQYATLGRGNVMQVLPSQMDRAKGTLRFRGTLRWDETDFQENGGPEGMPPVPREEMQRKTRVELIEQLTKLREQPWPMSLRKQRKYELKQDLESMGDDKWYSIDPVFSAVEMSTTKINNAIHTLDPLHGMLKRIEGKHGASVVAVFNFIRDMIRLNFVLALLGMAGILIPSVFSVSQDTDQAFGWQVENRTSGLCSAIQLVENSTLRECNKNYTEKIQDDVTAHSSQWTALIRDFLQGTGFLEWTVLFSGYYPPAVESGTYLISLAYLLSVLVIYVISLVFVVRFVAKFLRNASSSYNSYGMTFSQIVFTGWDFTIEESGAAKVESRMFIKEVKAAFDDEEYNDRRLKRTRKDNVKLYFGRILINLVIFALIGGSWAGIYFLVEYVPEPSEASDPEDTVKNFIWEYAPTMAVAGLNLIFPIIFSFLVKYEYYRGHVELFLTLSRCVLVRLTSLALLIISKVSLIYKQNEERDCNPNNEFICWETHLGQQVYAILVLDVIIQIGMTFVVNVLRSILRRLNNPFLKTLGTIEFFVPSHVLDIVYIQAVCWVGLLYSPLLVSCCFVYFCLIFFMKLFTLSVTCVPATRVFRASKSSAMFMTILAIAFFICLVPNTMALLYLVPSLACSPFRGLEYAWEALTYYICNLDGSAYWLRTLLFLLDGGILCMALICIVFLAAVYYISVINARGALIKQLEDKLKTTNKDLNYLMEQYKQAQEISTIN